MSEEKSEDFEPFTMISQEGEGGGIMGHLKASRDWVQGKHASVRPWAEFLDLRRVSRPQGMGDATKRLISNIHRFQSNYVFVFLGLVLYCVVTNPTLLFALAFCAAAWWFVAVKNKGENIAIFGRDTSSKELYALLGVIAVPLFYFAGAGSTVFWIIGASVVVILVHAILLSVPDQSGNEELGIVMEDVIVS